MYKRFGAALPNGAESQGTTFNGGAGIRTPVREKIDHSVYVRVPLIEVSSRWPVDSPLLDKSPKLSPTAGRRSSRLSRFFDTLKAASGGLLKGQVQQLLRVTQPGPSCCWRLKIFPEDLPGSERPGHAATASLTPSKPVAPVQQVYRFGLPKSTKNHLSSRLKCLW